MTMQTTRVLSLSIALMLGCFAGAARAQTYPLRTVTIVSNVPPAGGVDIVARLVAAELSSRWVKPVIVDSKPGATGTIGTAFVAHAPSDGHTILITAGPSITFIPFLSKVNYDPVRDLVPIAKVAVAPTVISVPAASPFRTLKDLVQAGRDPANKVLVGVPGIGSAPQVELAILNGLSGSNIATAPYRGATFILSDMLGNQIPAGAAAVPAFVTQIQEGKVRGLAVVSAERSSILRDIPTVREATGLDMDGFPTWYGFFAPAGTPPEIVARLETEILSIMREPPMVDKMHTLGNDMLFKGSKAFGEDNAIEIAMFKRAVEKGDIALQR
ncbi:Bug family tripartite tricarboxylate transporter substrate binding protein [Rhodoplanes sp. Z2-YC6860]|uniref:Bug family tripartite tricarboxylate transporter substrate binding protein n=1 Tax=Rhodoplanes sp. Z2-YC6860 TaxID=674703 RepID=UPI00078CF840|nr:tripartite tricarboxylate transporter substrate binding protein [Rhodoplanes sp. Z2-YC6860]AMN41132.1 extra-cytoplasmic solute receptor [Rhodoplanes sp. Z2-YC6860]